MKFFTEQYADQSIAKLATTWRECQEQWNSKHIHSTIIPPKDADEHALAGGISGIAFLGGAIVAMAPIWAQPGLVAGAAGLGYLLYKHYKGYPSDEALERKAHAALKQISVLTDLSPADIRNKILQEQQISLRTKKAEAYKQFLIENTDRIISYKEKELRTLHKSLQTAQNSLQKSREVPNRGKILSFFRRKKNDSSATAAFLLEKRIDQLVREIDSAEESLYACKNSREKIMTTTPHEIKQGDIADNAQYQDQLRANKNPQSGIVVRTHRRTDFSMG